MKTIIYFTLILLFATTTNCFAQSSGNTKEVPFQLTFITPLGTNGTNAGNSINKVSFNILAGYAAGLNGAEFGGIANINRDFMKGAQFAGITNFTGGVADGVQLAGITNINGADSKVAQFAGILNMNGGSTNGFQGAGICNFTLGSSKVVQAAGIGNFANDVQGAQLAGIINIASGYIDGAQIAGIGNFSMKAKGAQIAGITNITEYAKGTQIAGILNIARNVDGMQIALLNVADTVRNGIPIGMLSIVRDGYREFEVGISEGLNNYASYKIGVHQFYNIFSVGMQYLSDQFRWGFGYGIGTHLADKDDFKINLEAMSYHINEGSHWTSSYNGLQQLKLTFGGPASRFATFYAGPTFNLMVSNLENDNEKTGSNFPPYYIVSGTSGNTNLKFWVGFTAGIRIR